MWKLKQENSRRALFCLQIMLLVLLFTYVLVEKEILILTNLKK